MRITTLGTSHGDHTYCRFNSSTLFEIGERLYLVDCGEPVDGLMIRAGKNSDLLKAVFVTHMHEDHVGGLPDLIKSMIKYPNDELHTPVYLPEARAIPRLGAWLDAMHVKWPSPRVSVDSVREGPCFDDGTLSAVAVRTQHLVHDGTPVSFGYVLEAEGKRVVYTGDLRADFTDFPEVAKCEACDLCVCEVTHYKPESALPVLAKCPIKRLVLNHVHNPWHGDGEAELREILSSLPYPFDVAHDGDVFEL